MTNFQFLFTAYLVVWVIFFGYQLTVASRIASLRRDIEEFKKQMGER